ncbi:hypothetical protein XELAEV_18027892mg [Xenopus laevis]|uniref:DUF4637 domain-containing protein n=1 Tax=Xenopus laevis TaxID=8355 RepID=A0A974HK67_XENLA|nr:hypothetical protein XELAEV_18027892mg [Xenopus laevis]
MSRQDEKMPERDMGPDRSARKKRERPLKKKIHSLTLLCGSWKTHKTRPQTHEEKRKPVRWTGIKEQKVMQLDLHCGQMQRPKRMCPKCEIITCRKCDTLHVDTLFVAHSLLDHYDS